MPNPNQIMQQLQAARDAGADWATLRELEDAYGRAMDEVSRILTAAVAELNQRAADLKRHGRGKRA